MNSAYPCSHFYIDPSILHIVGRSIIMGSYTLVHGHRQSGKTTCCQALMRWFEDHPEEFPEINPTMLSDVDQQETYHGYEIYLVTFDTTIIVNDGLATFWKSVCSNLRVIDKSRFGISDNIISAFTFKEFFAKKNLLKPRPVVLLIDEASRLVSSIDNVQLVINDFLSVLRTLKDDRTNYCLHSVALFGTESIMDLIVHEHPGGRSTISPFSNNASWICGRFTEADIRSLFHQFAQTKSTSFNVVEIASDVFELTLGHKGLVGVCGDFIQISYDYGTSPIVSVDDWRKCTGVRLQAYIRGKSTYNSIIQRLDDLTLDQRFILSYVLRFGCYPVTSVS